MSGGGGTNTIHEQAEPPAWAVPYYQGYLRQGTEVANQPYRPYQGSRVAEYNPTQTTALNAITNRAMAGSAEGSAGRGELTSTLSGDYLNRQAPTNQYLDASNPYAGSNPYLEQSINAAQGDVVRNYNQVAAPSFASAGANSGSFGNHGLAEVENEGRRQLAGELGRISSGMRFGDYTQQQGLAENAVNRRFQGGESQAGRQQQAYEGERGRMLGSQSFVPSFANMDYQDASAMLGAGDALQQQQQRTMDDDYSRFSEARDYPLRQLDIIGRMLGGTNYGQSSSGTSTGPGSNRLATGAGGALTGAYLGSSLGAGAGAGAGAAGGAAAGSSAGWWGAGIGALLGLLAGG